jgi:alpha-beta hydrolase superfamily lysophospholipase
MEKPAMFTITCADGHEMPVHQWVPPGSCRAVVLLAHGMAEHGARYARFASEVNKAGIAVFADDHRGHGKAAVNIAMLGISGADWVNKQIDDLYTLQLQLRRSYGNVPLFLMGHSMGSFFAQRYAQLYSESIDGVILSGTNGYKDPLLPFGIGLSRLLMRLKGPNFKSRLIASLTFGKFNKAFKPNRTKFDWLSRDTAEVDAYVADPLCGFTSSVQLVYHLFVSLKETFSTKAISQVRKDLPVFAFAGGKDPVGMQGKGFMTLINNWKAAGITNLSYKLYKEGRHEMLNDINRDEVTADILQWIEKQLVK